MKNQKNDSADAVGNELWAMHVQGPDDMWAAPSKERAEAAAKALNDFWAEKIASKNDPDYPVVNAVVVPWDGTPEAHAKAVVKWAGEWGRVAKEPAPVAPAGKYADVLTPFVAMMEAELHANAGKGDRPGWLRMSADQALLEIYYHVAKLQKAVRNEEGSRIIENSADVANLCMMMVDICGGLEKPAPESARDWSLLMAEKEIGQDVSAGSHGLDEAPAAADVEALPASCGPARSLNDETLLAVYEQCAGRSAMHCTKVLHDRVIECRNELARRLSRPVVDDAMVPGFQLGVAEWMSKCFSPATAVDIRERGDRLLEEVIELLQSHGYDKARVGTLLEYVYGRPVGEPTQEVGGVMVTLAAYCNAASISMYAEGERELARINQPKVLTKIQEKQAAKASIAFDSPLPGLTAALEGRSHGN